MQPATLRAAADPPDWPLAWSSRNAAASLARVRTIALALAGLLATLVGCGEATTPEDVALEFWQAAVERDFDEAEPLSTAADEEAVAEFLGSFAPKQTPAIGEALKSEDRALVETTFLVDASQPPLVFRTQLILEGDTWRVDLAATRQELLRARIDAPLDAVEEAALRARSAADPEKAAQEASEVIHKAADALDEVGADEPTQAPAE